MTKYIVIGYSDQVIGEVDALDSVDAWSKARERFVDILDVRVGEQWISKTEYENWEKKANLYSDREDWEEEVRHFKSKTEIPEWEWFILNWYEIVREEIREGVPGYIVKVYTESVPD